jgi:hypothetical protein
MPPAPSGPAIPDPALVAACRAAVASADRERNPLALLAVAILFGFLMLSGATFAWLRLRMMPAVAAPVTLIAKVAPPAKAAPAKAAPVPPPPPAPAPNGTPSR